MSSFRDGIIYSNGSSVDLHSGDGVSRFASVFLILESDESEASTATRLPVVNDRHLLDVSVPTEHLEEKMVH